MTKITKPDPHRPTLRVLDILGAISTSAQGLTLTEAAEACGYNRGTILPIIRTLRSEGWLVQNPHSMRYRLGVGPFVLTQSVMEQNSQLRLITKEMHKVADICSAVCQLGVLDGQFVLYLAKIEAPQAGPTVSYVGKHIYATCTALGKALLCDSAPEDIRALYPGSLPQYVSASIRDYAKLQQELEDTRVKGFAFDKGECDPNTYCMAAPLRNREKIVAAVSVSVGNAKEFQEKKKIMTDSLTKARGNIELILNSNPEFMLFLP